MLSMLYYAFTFATEKTAFYKVAISVEVRPMHVVYLL